MREVILQQPRKDYANPWQNFRDDEITLQQCAALANCHKEKTLTGCHVEFVHPKHPLFLLLKTIAKQVGLRVETHLIHQ